MKKFTLLLFLLLSASIHLFANAEIVIYYNSTGTTIGSDFTISSNNFKNIVEAGDNIVVTVKDYTRVGGDYPYFQIQWGAWEGWNNLGTELSNGDNVIPLTAADVTKINESTTDGINFRTNGTTSYTITKVVLRKNDSYADLETVTLNDNSYEGGTQYQKVYSSNDAAKRMSDGDLLVVVGTSDANAGGSWSMRELSTWDNVYSTGSFDGRDYAYIVASGKGSRIHADGFQFVTNKGMSAVKIAKKIYSLSQSETPVFSSIVLGSPVNVKLTRTLKAGWNTICLPFATNVSSIPAGAELYEFTAAGASAITLTKKDDGAMVANTPYFVKTTAAISDPIVFTDVTVSNAGAGTVTCNGMTLHGNYTAELSMENKYGVSDNAIKYGTTGATLKAFSAYIDGAYSSGAREFSIMINDDVTGISTMQRETMGNDAYYNLSGQRITQPTKGLYIVNGKKVIIK